MAEYNLKTDPAFRDLMLSRRARLLAEVDECERFLSMDSTKDMREAVRQARRGNYGKITLLIPQIEPKKL